MSIDIGIDENGKPFTTTVFGSSHGRIARHKGKSIIAFPDNYVVIDLETTGLDPCYSEIIEISAVKYSNGVKVSTFSQLVRPEYPVDDFITNLTGITNDMLQNASMICDVLPHFLSFVSDSILVGHNVNFDVNFIYDNCELLHLPQFTNDFIDTMRIARKLFPDLKNHKLVTLASSLGVSYENIHRSLSDCEATACVYDLMRTAVYEKYGTCEDFSKKSGYKKTSAGDIVAQTSNFDVENPLYGKVCCFTGALDHFSRKDAMQLVTNLGGVCSDNVTKKTNYLILGNTDYCRNVKGDKTSKMKKAEKAMLSSQDIQIISENIFYEMVGFNSDKGQP